MVVRGPKLRRLSYLKGIKIALFFVPYNYCLCLKGISKHKFLISTCFTCRRVVSYIKNCLENNFMEKWQHLAASKPVDQTAIVSCDFPESAQRVSLVDAKDDVLKFNIQNIVSYFVERKAKDNEFNKD